MQIDQVNTDRLDNSTWDTPWEEDNVGDKEIQHDKVKTLDC